jgi:hypothetical protein
MPGAKNLQAICDRIVTQVGAAANHQAGGFAAGVRIDNLDSAKRGSAVCTFEVVQFDLVRLRF